MKDLTARQLEILETVLKYEQDTGDPCRIEYLSRQLKITSLGVRHHVEALYRKGWLEAAKSPIQIKVRPGSRQK